MTNTPALTLLRRAVGLLSGAGVALLMVGAAFGLATVGAVCLDTRLVSLPELLERSDGRWELAEVVGLDASDADRFARAFELRWDRVEPDASVGDDGTRAIAVGCLVRDGVELPVDARWRRTPASSLAVGLDARGGDPIEGWPELSLMMRVGACFGAQELWVVPHGIELPELGDRSLRYTRAN